MMGQFIPKTFQTILERMINRVVARSDLTDINDGSSLKQVLAAAAREDDDCHFQMINLLDLFDIDKCIGNDLDERAKQFNPSITSRIEARKAVGQVRFSRVSTVGDVSISIGTIVQVPASGVQSAILFITTALGTIASGSTQSNLVDAVALEAGTAGNAALGTITAFQTKPSGVDAVTNPAVFASGRDYESDDEFRDRLTALIRGLARCHDDGLESAALGIEDSATGKTVVFAHVYEDSVNRGDVLLYIDDGSGTAEDTTTVAGESILASAVGGETVIYLPHKPIKTEEAFNLYINAALVTSEKYTVNPASGQINLLAAYYPTGLTAGQAVTGDYTYFTGLIAEVQKVIDGDSADRVNYPGYRAAGVLVRVVVPSIVYQAVIANITVLSGYDQSAVAESVTAAISQYINSLSISDDVILERLSERALSVAGMYDVSFSSPTENQVITDSQMARVLDSNITIA